MINRLLTVSLETSSGNGEDSHLTYPEDTASRTCVIGVFDGLGGRSAGFDGQKGGQIASTEASRLVQEVLNWFSGNLNEDIANQIQSTICQFLKSQADTKMPKSRLSGTLTGKRLCTTIALASITEKEEEPHEIKLAWMGDSRVYFLSPQKGLQQLTVDDLEVKKDAFEMIREDPPMSQYLTADIPSSWHIHYASEEIEESGCILACTDGCFQYLPTPWDFEKLLLETLSSSDSLGEWEKILAQRYEQIKQDDVSLIIYPLGFTSFENIKENYQPRLQELNSSYDTEASNFEDLSQFWNCYRSDYEARLKIPITRANEKIAEPETKETVVTPKILTNLTEPVERPDSEITISKISETLELIDSQKSQVAPEFSSIRSDSTQAIDTGSIEKQRIGQISRLYEEAMQLEQTNEVVRAMEKYRDILKIDSNNLDANFKLGQIYLEKSEFKRAINHLEKVYKAKGKYYKESLDDLIESYYKDRQFTQINSYFKDIPGDILESYNEYFLEIFAHSLVMHERFTEAMSMCGVILEKDRRNPKALYLIGFIRHFQNSLDAAEEYLRDSQNFYLEKFNRTKSNSDWQGYMLAKQEHKLVTQKLANQTSY